MMVMIQKVLLISFLAVAFISCQDSKRKAIELKQEGIDFLYKSQFKEAIDKFENSLSYNESDAETYYYLGNAWFGLGDEDKAIEYYSHSISTDSTFGKAYVNRGKIYKERGDDDLACSDWLKAESFGVTTLIEDTKFCK